MRRENSFRFEMYILPSSAASRMYFDPDHFLYIQYIHFFQGSCCPES